MPAGKEQKGIGKHFVQTFNYFTSFAVWAAQGYVFVWSHQTFRALLFFLLQLAHCIHSMELYSTDIHRCELWSSRFRAGGWYQKKKKSPSTHFFACKPRSWSTMAALSLYLNIIAGLIQSSCLVKSTVLDLQPLSFRREKHQILLTHFLWIIQLYVMAMNMSGLSFWEVSSQPYWPCWATCTAPWPLSLMEIPTGSRQGLSHPSCSFTGSSDALSFSFHTF